MTDGRWTVDRQEAQVDPILIPPLPFEGARVQRERIKDCVLMWRQAWPKGPSGASDMVLTGETVQTGCSVQSGSTSNMHGTQFCMVTQSEKLHQTIVGELQVAPPYLCSGHELRAFYRLSCWRPEFPCINITSRARRYGGRRHHEGHTVRGRCCWDFFLQNAMTQAGKEGCGASRYIEENRRCLATSAVLDWAVGDCRHSVTGGH